MTRLFTTLAATFLTIMTIAQHENRSIQGKWIITSLMMEGKLTEVSGKAYELEFKQDENRMAARICNRMGGSYNIEGNQIKFGNMFSTKMMCPDMEYESAFGKALMQVDHFSFEKNRMLLKKGDETLLVLSMPVN